MVEFCDDGWSGKNFERPAVKELIAQARIGEIQCVIVKDLSRFGRDYIIVGNYISRVFPFLGVRFIAVNDNFDSIRPEDLGSLETSFKTMIYDFYSRQLSRKVRDAKLQLAKKGEFLSHHAPYGYTKDLDRKKHLVIDPPAAEVVRRIFQMVADGQSAAQTAKALNLEGVLTPMRYKLAANCSRTVWNCIHEENFWTDQAIIRIIRDERYLGKVVYGKRFYDIVGHRHSVKVSKKDWIVVDEMHDGIVTQEMFSRAQAALRDFMERNGTPATATFREKVRCGICGHAMKREPRKSPYYFCRTSKMTNAFPCTTERIPELDIIDALLSGLRAQAAIAVEWDRILEEKHSRRRIDAAAIHKSIAALREELSRQEAQAQELYEAFVLGEVNRSVYLEARAAAQIRHRETADRIAELETELDIDDKNGTLRNRFVTSFQKYTEVKEITSEIVADVLNTIFVYPDGRLEIIWNYREEYEKLLLSLYGDEQ